MSDVLCECGIGARFLLLFVIIGCPFLMALVRLRCRSLCLHCCDVNFGFLLLLLVSLPSDAKTLNAHPATIAGSLRAEIHAVMQFLAVAPLIFDQFVIARRCLQRRLAIIVCRRVCVLWLNLADWSHPSIWFVHFTGDTQAVHVCGMNFMGACCQLCLRPLQPLAQALDVFIVWLVLLLVHFQQCPQDFDAMLFFHHTLSVFELAYNSPYRAFVAAGFELISSVFIIVGFLWLLFVSDLAHDFVVQ